MSESFAALLDESLSTLEMQPGSIVTGVVLDVDKEWVAWLSDFEHVIMTPYHPLKLQTL